MSADSVAGPNGHSDLPPVFEDPLRWDRMLILVE
jgi:hypothetical protein